MVVQWCVTYRPRRTQTLTNALQAWLSGWYVVPNIYSAASDKLTSDALKAIDLGMNRNADYWTTDGKQPIFTDVEKQIRKHIWWSCCISDKYALVHIGQYLLLTHQPQVVCCVARPTYHLPCKRLLHIDAEH